MKNSWTPLLLLVLGGIFLIKGGVAVIVGLWKFFLPALFLGGGYYLVRKYLKSAQLAQGTQSGERIHREPASPQSSKSSKSAVIEICPHCLAEVGSCPKCC